MRGLFNTPVGIVGWVLEIKESFNKLIAEVEVKVKLILSVLSNFSWVGVEN